MIYFRVSKNCENGITVFIFFSFINISPLLGVSILAIVFKILDLPQPLTPIIVVILPFGISKFKSFTISKFP